jgi:hypothetical protein
MILVSFLYLLLKIAIVILVAYAIEWTLRSFIGIQIDGNVYKWGKIVVGLICVVLVVAWLLGALGVYATSPRLFP